MNLNLTLKPFLLIVVTTLILCALVPARAADITPAVVFSSPGKFDKSFNQSAYEGAERFKLETGIDYKETEVADHNEIEAAFRTLIQQGATIIAGIGFQYRQAIEIVAAEFPDTKFTLIGGVVDLPNVRSIVFKDHEGCFLVGMLAALVSKTGKIGFIGGMDIPLIRNFGAGYEEGAKYVNPNIEVFHDMTGTTPEAWNDPDRGSELALSQYERGADVVFAAAGFTGTGVFHAALKLGKLAIGVDSNQNHLHPGTILTSMLKRVDIAVYKSFTEAKDGTWNGGLQTLGLAENGVGWALDEHNRNLISQEVEAKLEQAEKDIISGKIVVKEYQENPWKDIIRIIPHFFTQID